ncbi:MAG: DNA methyltransferase [Nanobdellota archaeon]
MKKLFFLSKEDLSMSRAELTYYLGERVEFLSNLGFASAIQSDFDRLAMTKSVGNFLFKCPVNRIEELSKKFNWTKYCVKDFCVRSIKLDDTHIDKKTIAGIIHKTAGLPAKMNKPDSLFEIFGYKGIAYFTKRLWVNTDKFNERKAHKRPMPHPTSIHPKLAKACVNLTGVKKGMIVDPFCGSGGILIEAGLMGLEVKGYDLLGRMLSMCEKNLLHWGIKDYSLFEKDALLLENCDYIVTDPPYGQNTYVADLKALYDSFLARLRECLIKRAVIIFPDSYDFYEGSKKAGLKIVQKFDWYIHKRMTRRIVILEIDQ